MSASLLEQLAGLSSFQGWLIFVGLLIVALTFGFLMGSKR